MKWNERIEFLPLNTTNAVPCPSRKPFWFLCECESASYVLKNTQRWGFTCINMTHLNSFLSGEQQRQMGAILLCLCSDGGEKWKKNPMQFREVYLKLLENILPQALCPAAADNKNIWYILLILWQLATPVWVFLCAAQTWCSQVLPLARFIVATFSLSWRECKCGARKHWLQLFSFFFSFRCRLKSTSCFFVLFFFLHLASQASRWWDDSSALLSALLTIDLCLTPDPVSHIPFVVQANPPSLFPTLPLYWPGWD